MITFQEIAYVTSTGSVELFIKRYLEQKENEFELPRWSELKGLLQKRFADTSDPAQAMAILRKIKQKPDESVQIFSERFLRIAEDAYPSAACENEAARKILEKQLVDIFCDSLYYDYLRLKVMREEPRDFESAVNIAMNEQNLRKRFYLRSGEEVGQTQAQNGPFYNSSNGWTVQNAQPTTVHWPRFSENRDIEPMDVDHLRRNVCYKCRRSGHKSRDCPQNRTHNRNRNGQRPRNFNVSAANVGMNTSPQVNKNETKDVLVPDWVKRAECWFCHLVGHLQRNCPSRRPQAKVGVVRPRMRNDFRRRPEN